jgi:hypothetical protein
MYMGTSTDHGATVIVEIYLKANVPPAPRQPGKIHNRK